MNELQIFNNEEFGEIRTVTIDGEPWFVGKDIATILGYADPRSTVSKKVDAEDKGVAKMDTPSGTQEMTIINESGMYSLVIGSKLESAKRFKHWVTSEVLPSIRKNGGYIAGQEELTDEELLAKALLVAQNKIAERDRQIADMQPKADYFDALVDKKLNTNFRDTSKEFGMGEREFIQWLIDHNYIYRNTRNQIRCYAQYSESGKGLFTVKDAHNRKTSWAGVQVLITPKGRATFQLLLSK